jgi:hypothetical protein
MVYKLVYLQDYVKLTNTTNAPKDIAFRISQTDLLPFMRKIEGGYDGLGFYADKFKLLYQIVSDENTAPTQLGNLMIIHPQP